MVWSTIELEEQPNFRLSGHSCSHIGQSQFIFGGKRVGGSFRNTMFEIDISKFTCRPIEEEETFPPDFRAFHGAGVYGTKIIIYGGLNESQILTNYHTFNIFTRKWTHAKTFNTPSPREHFSFSIDMSNHHAFLFGGYYCTPECDAEFNYDEQYRLNLKDLEWRKVDAEITSDVKPKGRCMHTTEIINGILYQFGGQVMTDFTTEVLGDQMRIDVDRTANELTWEIATTSGLPPCPRYCHASTYYNVKMVIHGGNNSKHQTIDDMYILCTMNLNWTKVNQTFNAKDPGNAILGRYHHSLEASDDSLWVQGGVHSEHKKNMELSFSIQKISF